MTTTRSAAKRGTTPPPEDGDVRPSPPENQSPATTTAQCWACFINLQVPPGKEGLPVPSFMCGHCGAITHGPRPPRGAARWLAPCTRMLGPMVPYVQRNTMRAVGKLIVVIVTALITSIIYLGVRARPSTDRSSPTTPSLPHGKDPRPDPKPVLRTSFVRR